LGWTNCGKRQRRSCLSGHARTALRFLTVSSSWERTDTRGLASSKYVQYLQECCRLCLREGSPANRLRRSNRIRNRQQSRGVRQFLALEQTAQRYIDPRAESDSLDEQRLYVSDKRRKLPTSSTFLHDPFVACFGCTGTWGNSSRPQSGCP
jgi:hypothetical protein